MSEDRKPELQCYIVEMQSKTHPIDAEKHSGRPAKMRFFVGGRCVAEVFNVVSWRILGSSSEYQETAW